MDCPRRHWFLYERGLRPKRTPTAFLVGGAFHDAVSDYYAGVADEQVLARAGAVTAEANGVASVGGEWHEAEEWETGEYQAAKLRGMLRAYARTYSRDEFSDVLILEKRLAVPWVCGDEEWILSGRFDGVVRDDLGESWLLEHKTTAAAPLGLVTNLRLDFQCNFYLHMAGLLAEAGELPRVSGVLYNVVVKPGIRPILVHEARWEEVFATAESKAEAVETVLQRCSEADRRFVAVTKRRQTPEEHEARVERVMLEDPVAYFVRRRVTRSERQQETFAAELASVLGAFRGNAGFPNFQSCERCGFRVLCSASPEDRPRLQEELFEIAALQR